MYVHYIVDAIKLAHDTSTTSDGKPLVDAVFTAHPSNLAIPGDIEKVKVPVSIAQGSDDIVMNMATAKTIQDIFAKKDEEGGGGEVQGRKFEIRIVDNAKHGFAARGDPEDEAELGYAQIAEDQAVEWFGRWLIGKK